MKFIILFLISITVLAQPTVKNINRTFDEISNRYEIPSEILKAIAYKKSGWSISSNSNKIEEDNKGEYGIMGLSMDNIKEGISLLGRTQLVDAIIDYKVNIEVTAIILKNLKEEAYNNGVIIKNIQDYAPIIATYNNSEYNLLSKNFTRKIFNIMRKGYTINTNKGSMVIPPIDLPFLNYPEITAFYKTYTRINSLSDIEHHWSPNSSSRGSSIDQIIIHLMQGSFSGSESWFMNPNSHVSAHYLISREGEILQMVRLTGKAWHAGSHNSRSIGIEHEGYWHTTIHSDTTVTEAEYQASAMLTRWLTERYGIPKIHRDAYHDANGNFTPWHLKRPALANLAGILGHHDCNGKEMCPGGNWNWTYYMNLVNGTNSSEGDLNLLTPRDNQTVGNPVIFTSTANGDIRVVKYYADGDYLLGESSNSSNNYRVEYQFYGLGNRHVSAKAFDANGNYVSGTEIEVDINIVENHSEGNLTLLTPGNNQTVNNPVVFTSTADGDIRVVKYFADGDYLLGESSNSNDNYRVEYQFYGLGNRNVSAKAFDINDIYIEGTEKVVNINIIEHVSSGNLTLLTPGDNQTVGNPVIFTSMVDGDIKTVKYFADGDYLLGESSNSNDNYKVEYQFYGLGNRNVSAKAFDAAGEYIEGTEKVVNINIVDRSIGNLTLLSPANSQQVNNPVIFTSTADGNIKTVKYFADGDYLLGESSNSNDNYKVEYRFYGLGDRIVSAKAFDANDEYIENTEIEIHINIIETNCNNSCTPNEKRCFGNFIQKCVNDNGCTSWKTIDSCFNGRSCLSGYCVEADNCSNECDNVDEIRCFSNSIKKCGQFDEDNCLEWQEIDNCSNGETCNNGSCVGNCIGDSCNRDCVDECEVGQTSCDNNNGVKICKRSDSTNCYEWKDLRNCENNTVCSDGTCIPRATTNSCTNYGDLTCDGSGVTLCKSSDDGGLNREVVEECNGSCNNGKCIEEVSNRIDNSVSAEDQFYACSYSNSNSNNSFLLFLLLFLGILKFRKYSNK